jgi:hypothetical protein
VLKCAVNGEEVGTFAYVGPDLRLRDREFLIELFNVVAIKSLLISAGDCMKDMIKESAVRLGFTRAIFSASCGGLQLAIQRAGPR